MKHIATACLLIGLILTAAFWQKISYTLQQYQTIDYVLQSHGVIPPSMSLPTNAPWEALFNGHNLDGWTVRFTGLPVGENFRNTFRAANGVLSVDYSGWGEDDKLIGHLFTDKTYSRYILRFDYRFVGEQAQAFDSFLWAWARRNNGAMLHSQSPHSMQAKQDFPVSMEAQLLGGLSQDEHRPTGNLCTPGTFVTINGQGFHGHCVNSVSPSFHGDDWVHAEFEVLGAERIRHFINGELVFEYTEPEYDTQSPDTQALQALNGELPARLDRGHIALQAETSPVQFRNIDILPL